MPINVKGLFETLQYKANNIDSSTSTAEILDTLKAIKLSDGNTVISYDSDGALPTATDTNVKIAYIKNTGITKFNNGTWDTLTGSLSATKQTGTSQYGVNFGFLIGGRSSAGYEESIQRYSFATDANATELTGEMSQRSNSIAGQSSSTHGYGTGGRLQTPTSPYSNIIEKIPFTVDENATDVGDLTVSRGNVTGNQSDTHGYTSGGFHPPSVYSNVIDKFPFATDGNATDVGNLPSGTGGQNPASTTSTTHGYVMGGTPAGPDPSDRDITKFSFATDGNSVDVGDLLNEYAEGRGVQSTTKGYHMGGSSPIQLNPSQSNIIEGFPFANDGNSVDIGDLIQRQRLGTSTSSSTDGYLAGGYGDPTEPITGDVNIIQKFSFASEGNTADVGDLVNAGSQGAGVQY